MNATDRSHAHNLLDTCIANGGDFAVTGFLRGVIEDPELSHKLLSLGEALQLEPLDESEEEEADAERVAEDPHEGASA